MSCEQDTLNYLVNHMGAPCLGILPWLEQVRPEMLAGYLNIDGLFEN